MSLSRKHNYGLWRFFCFVFWVYCRFNSISVISQHPANHRWRKTKDARLITTYYYGLLHSNQHPSRTTDLPQVSWETSSHEIRNSQPGIRTYAVRGPYDYESTTLTIRPRRPPGSSVTLVDTYNVDDRLID